MIENYINQIIKMDILADCITIIDANYIIRYFKLFNKEVVPVTASKIEGRSIFEVFTDIDPATSTVVKALKGESSYNQQVYMTFNGIKHLVIENVYPIVMNKQIIGAVCISRSPGKENGALSQVEIHEIIGEAAHKIQLDDIKGISPQIVALKRQILQVADTDINVLICGETGTGKEMVAESIHNLSKRSDNMFFSQNCAAIPSSLLESIFFGSEKGIYTGSIERAGILERASEGTVFFDEINSLEISLQAKILKVIEEKRTRRLGSIKEIPTDFRTIAAMNENPFECMKSGSLRRDLFYRLSTVILEIPPLRARREDILFLADFFLSECNKKNMKQLIGLSPQVESLFMQYDWPGNVRELKNVIESAYVFSESSYVELSDLPAYMSEANASIMEYEQKYNDNALSSLSGNSTQKCLNIEVKENDSWKDIVDRFEKEALEYLLSKEDNHTVLSKKLGISRQTLLNKIKKTNNPHNSI